MKFRICNDTGLKLSAFTLFLLITSFLLPLSSTFGQETDHSPKIGLALSGGGACGIAHIGVLKVMEEAGLRPDYITGVSMGSLIGGLYSIGYSADSMEKLFKTIDWNLILSNSIPASKIIFPAKRHYNNSIVTLPVNFRKSILPSGLINGQQMENMLSYYLWTAEATNDFSKLPIPFMCLATNLETCKKVELKRGYLPDAIRASMSVPTIFTPSRIDSLILIDGGMVRNLAVSEARKMGAGFVIGSYTGSYLSKKDELQSVTGVLAQLLFFVGVYDFEDQKKLLDILIEPKTDDLSSTDFGNIDTLIARGYRAALPFRATFKKLADSIKHSGQENYKDYLQNNLYYRFDRIEINGTQRISKKQISGILDIHPGEMVSRDKMKEKIDLLYGKAWFDKIKYRVRIANDSMILVIDCIEEPKTILYGSVHYDNAMHSGLVLSLTMKNPVIQRSFLDINTYIGHFYMADFKYYQFIDRSQKYSISQNIFFENTYMPRMSLYGETGGTFNRNAVFNISAGKRFGLNQMISLAFQIENRNLIPDYISTGGLTKINANYISDVFEYKINTLNAKQFPCRGVEAGLSLTSPKMISGKITGDSVIILKGDNVSGNSTFKRFYTMAGYFRHYFSIEKKWTIGLNGDILFITNTDNSSSLDNFFYLGGYEPVDEQTIAMAGFHPFEIPVKKTARIGMDIDYEIFEKVHLEMTSGFAEIEEAENLNGYSFLAGFGLGCGYMTVFGPMKAGIMYGVYRHEKYFAPLKGYISLGFGF